MARVLVMVGTRKGAFFCWSDEGRRQWRVEGPLLKGWEVLDLTLDNRSEPAIYAAMGHMVYGPTIHVSRDLGRTWEQIEEGPAFAPDAGRKLKAVWTVVPGRPSEPGVLYAGVADAGLFRSRDGGARWAPLGGLNDHPTRPGWQPGLGGLCCHSIALDPESRSRMWVGISAVGVLRSDDGGATWTPKNSGVPAAAPSEEKGFEEIGRCVHRLVLAPDQPDLLYQQNHKGMFRSRDGGDSWQRIESGLPSSFGFPLVMHPADSSTLYSLSLESDEYRFFPGGRAAVYRTRDGGASWHPLTRGLPEAHCYTGVLRNALAVDGLPECGIYFGTTGGQVFYSRDEGESWEAMPCLLPRIASVSAAVVD